MGEHLTILEEYLYKKIFQNYLEDKLEVTIVENGFILIVFYQPKF